MATNKLKADLKHITLFSLLALTLTGCPSSICFNPDPSYTFAVTARFTPEQDSIRLGDTLYLLSEFPSTMIPMGGQEPVNYSHSTGIHNTLGVRVLEPNTTVASDAVFSFDYFNVSGSIYNDRSIPRPNGIQQLKYGEASGKYLLKIGIEPKKKGIYSLVIGDGFSNGRTTGDQCTKAGFPTSIANADPHIYYLEEFMKDPTLQIPKIHNLFKVY